MELDFTKPENLQTRDGRQVRIYATDGAGAFPVHGAVHSKEEGVCLWHWAKWAENGKNYSGTKELFRHKIACGMWDLIPKPVRVTGWCNRYPGTNSLGAVHDSKEGAASEAGHGCLGQIYIDAEIQP